MKRPLLLLPAALGALLAAWWLFTPGEPEPLAPHVRAPVAAVAPPSAPLSAPPADGFRRPVPAAPLRPAADAADPVRPADAEAPPAGEPGAGLDEDVLQEVEVTVWPASVEGIKGAVREVSPAIQSCYEAALKEVPDLKGRVTVNFEILDADGIGKVQVTPVDDDTLEDAPTIDCIQRALGALQFDPPDGKLTVNWPFIFQNG